MKTEEIRRMAEQYGFFCSYCLPTKQAVWEKPQGTHPDAQRLCYDVPADYPHASALLLLIKKYVPYPIQSGYPGYYVASNEGYHACKAFVDQLRREGNWAEQIEVPAKRLAREADIGVQLKNSLLALPDCGTRVVLFTVVTDACEPELLIKRNGQQSPCENCHACETACPSQAIQEQVYDWQRCIRAYMDADQMPEWVMEKMDTLLGCERCQAVCPLNAAVGTKEPEPELVATLELARLLTGDQAQAKKLLGKNMATHQRFLVHSAVLAANRKRTDLLPQLRALQASDKAAVRDAADWAIQRLEKEKNE